MKHIKRIFLPALAVVIAVPAIAAAADFSPEATFELSDRRVKANPQMTIKVAQDNGEEELQHVTLRVPAGFKLPNDAAVPNNDQIGSGTINIAAGPGCRPGAPVGDAKAPATASATVVEQDRTDEQIDSGVKAVWVLRITIPGIAPIPLEIRGSRASGFVLDGEITPSDNTCPPLELQLRINSQTASGVPVLKNPRFPGRYRFSTTFTSQDSDAVVTIPQVIRITR